MIVKKLLTEDTVGQAADQLNAEPVYSGSGDIEQTLDRALKVNRRKNRDNETDYTNVLLIGEAGTGKTSRVRDWAKKNGINLFEIRASSMDATDLGGAITPDKDFQTVKRLASTEFDALDRPNSVLFLDEYNRAPQAVRAPLLELINSHVVPDPREPDGNRKLKNLLFTVAAINPADYNYNTDTLDKAELSRFKKLDVYNDSKNLLGWIINKYENKLKRSDLDEEEILEIKGKEKLATALLDSKLFKFDTAEDIQSLGATDSALNSRTFTMLLDACDGTKEDFLDNWNSFCNPNKKGMVENILADYVDVDDKATQVLQQHDTESEVFGKKKASTAKKMAQELGLTDLDID